MSTDPAGQFWSPYKYSANPVYTVDPNGEWVFTIVCASVAVSAINIVKAIDIARQSGSFLDGWTAWSWNSLAAIDPVTTSMSFGGIEMVSNIVANSEGWKGEGWEGFGEFIQSGIAGWTTGTITGFNASTYGVLSKPFGALVAGISSASHHLAYEGGGDYRTTKKVLQKLYSYGASGSIIKTGGDVTWANHVVNEGPFVYDNWYDEAKNKYKIMSGKISGSVVGNKDFGYYGTGNNETVAYNKFGHRFFGSLLPSRAFYYGFEAWGEPYERWAIDDFDDDHWHNKSSTNPFNDPNATPEGTIDFQILWEDVW